MTLLLAKVTRLLFSSRFRLETNCHVRVGNPRLKMANKHLDKHQGNPLISSHPGLLVLLLLGCAVLTEGSRTISVPKLKGIEPQVVEIPPGGLPLSLFRNKRQTFNASHIGVTAKLAGDNHNVAVVHWSGYPSEVSVAGT